MLKLPKILQKLMMPKDGISRDHMLYEHIDISRYEQAEITKAFARLFSSDDGKIVLGYLQSTTFQRALNASASSDEIRYSEGQRALLTSILRLIKSGRRG